MGNFIEGLAEIKIYYIYFITIIDGLGDFFHKFKKLGDTGFTLYHAGH